MKMKSLVGLASIMVAIVNCSAEAAVVLNSYTVPSATTGSTLNTIVDFTAEGTYDWIHFGSATAGSGVHSTAGNEKSVHSLFSNISITGPTTTASIYRGTPGLQNQGCGIIFLDGTSPASVTNGTTNSARYYMYNRNAVANDGLTFTYSMPANSTQIIKIYLECYNQIGKFSLMSAASGVLYADASAVPLPSAGNVQGNYGNTAGVYTFTVTNDSSVADTLTFAYVQTASGGSVGFQGVTVAAVPEVASLGILGLGIAPLLTRRRNGVR